MQEFKENEWIKPNGTNPDLKLGTIVECEFKDLPGMVVTIQADVIDWENPSQPMSRYRVIDEPSQQQQSSGHD